MIAIGLMIPTISVWKTASSLWLNAGHADVWLAVVVNKVAVAIAARFFGSNLFLSRTYVPIGIMPSRIFVPFAPLFLARSPKLAILDPGCLYTATTRSSLTQALVSHLIVFPCAAGALFSCIAPATWKNNTFPFSLG